MGSPSFHSASSCKNRCPLLSRLQRPVGEGKCGEEEAHWQPGRVWSDDERLMALFLTSHLHQQHAARG
eukprot:1133658-Rhodomonas_salina.1